jgi:site-specific recombinase XerD
MSKRKQDADVNEFWSLARSFLKVYLPSAREVSQNTVKAYKQALETLIKYLEDSGFTRDTITIGMFLRPRVLKVLWFGCLKNKIASREPVT